MKRIYLPILCAIGVCLSLILLHFGNYYSRIEADKRPTALFVDVLTDLYTSNFYETENPHAKIRLVNALKELKYACEAGCDEWLDGVIDRLEDLAK
jgi:hypothetical protein